MNERSLTPACPGEKSHKSFKQVLHSTNDFLHVMKWCHEEMWEQQMFYDMVEQWRVLIKGHSVVEAGMKFVTLVRLVSLFFLYICWIKVFQNKVKKLNALSSICNQQASDQQTLSWTKSQFLFEYDLSLFLNHIIVTSVYSIQTKALLYPFRSAFSVAMQENDL